MKILLIIKEKWNTTKTNSVLPVAQSNDLFPSDPRVYFLDMYNFNKYIVVSDVDEGHSSIQENALCLACVYHCVMLLSNT